jgi:UDP-N-acetylmuramoyl-tripeptide--D-alanyl-D-alanine ligase
MTPADFIITLAAILVAIAVAAVMNLKWLRVAQRVHYLPGEVGRIQRLWFERRPIGVLWWAGAVVIAIVSFQGPEQLGLGALAWLAVVAPLLMVPTPWRLPLKGTTSALQWTARAKRVYGGILAVQFLTGGLAVWLAGPAGVLIPLLLAANLTDLALGVLWQVERKLSRKFVIEARRKLKRVGPQVVAITGSYGKTSTKGYVAHILGKAHQTVASPASFNNMMGLSRTINEHLVIGTSVFVAEMGMNQEGRIRELCELFNPDIAAITVIGEAHMERLGSQEAIFRAKAEITEKAKTVVLPVDQPELVALIEKCRREGKTVITVSGQGNTADVIVDPDRGLVTYGPDASPTPMAVPPFGHGVNVAVALGIGYAVKVPQDEALARLADLPVAAHRAEVQKMPGGVWIIDDTYNSNPVGAARAIDDAAALAKERGGPLVVVTPGMVELGPVQFQRNSELAQRVVAAQGALMAVGLTNRKALVTGSAGAAQLFATRADAVTAALHAAGANGVILYENDLPDHYP